MSENKNNQVINFGCRLNAYESEIMQSLADQSDLEDTFILNSCAVTAEAERQVKQKVRKLKKTHPNAKIIVTGCSAQIHPEKWQDMSEVDRVLGNQEKLNPKYYALEGERRVFVNDIQSVRETAGHLIDGFHDRARAFIQVQNGCDHRCTFCIIPYGRGPSRSVPIGEIVQQTRKLIENGYQEIVLTGVDLTSYGSDLPGTPSLGVMIRRLLAQVPELPRLRISSIDSIEVDEELFHVIAHEERVMPHLHLSLQAGDNMVLKRMKRRHLREDAIEFCQKIKQVRPEMVFGADIIAGFPTETEEMFANSLRLVDECDLTYLHVFPYSAREGTPAARMPQVAKELRKERAARLREKGQEKLQTHFAEQMGKTKQILFEKQGFGHAEDYSPVKLVEENLQQDHHGKVLPVKIIEQAADHLIGKAN